MPRKNADLVRRAYEVFNRWGLHPAGERDPEMPRLLHPEIEFHTYAGAPEAGVYRGHEAVFAYHAQLFGEFESVQVELNEVLETGDHVVAVTHQHTVPRASSAEIVQQVVDLWTIRDGLLAERRAFPTRAAALESLEA